MTFELSKIVLASGNKGKLAEFKGMFGDYHIDVVPQSEFDVPDADETGLSFVENAILKARHAARLTGLPALADDSGLSVVALQGEPGIYSARYAGEPSDDQANIDKLLDAMTEVDDRQREASFMCVLAFVRHADDPVPVIAQGQWSGQILRQRAGQQGFGYDPIFYVPSEACSAAELTKERKNQLSHRGQAISQLKIQLEALGLLA